MRGDLLFFKGNGSLSSRLIQWRTRGPFVHVEVDLGDGTAIGASWREGVTRHPVNYSNAVSYSLDTSTQRIEAGIQFLLSCVGEPYSWSDILNQALTVLLPDALLISQQHAYDCSDLAARYIEIAGGISLGHLLDNPQLISPNDLARHAHLL